VTGRAPGGRSATLRLAGAIGPILALLLLVGALVLVDQQHRARADADATVRAAVASAVASVGANLQAMGTGADRGDQVDLRPAASVEGVPDLLPIAVRARDSGLPLLADVADPPSLVVPVFTGNAAPQSTDQRRSALIGYRLVPVSLQPVLLDLAPTDGGLIVRGPTRTVATTAGEAPSSAVSFATRLALPQATGWVVAAWVPSPGTPPVTWVWLFALLVLCGGLGTLGAATQLRWLAAEERRSRYDRRHSLVNGLAPLLQATVDLAEVAPAVCSHLGHTLSLTGVSLSVPAESGERPVFSCGTPPDATVLPLSKPPERLDRGRTFAVSLTRGGRILGVLRVVAGESLARADLDALTTAAELLGSTLAHAEAFARQQQVVARLHAIDELKTVFLATASHELRTPVTAIVGFSALLLDEWDNLDPAQGRMLLERVVSNARELQSLIEQLLDFARLERGVRPEDDELLDLGSTVGTVLAARPELASDHDLGSCLTDGCLIRGSASAIERIVTNLVGNAGKYSPSGTRIVVTVSQDAGRVALVVDDEGPGVAPEDREHVFSRFYRGRSPGVTGTRGAGIGLAIVAEYAGCMAGTATVTDSPSGGARFAVSFPSAGSLDAVLPLARRPDASRNGAHRVSIT
jgi:signal transduction histidine kinase